MFNYFEGLLSGLPSLSYRNRLHTCFYCISTFIFAAPAVGKIKVRQNLIMCALGGFPVSILFPVPIGYGMHSRHPFRGGGSASCQTTFRNGF